MKYISILGSTGSIGTQALNVIRRHGDKLKAVCLTAHSNIELIKKQLVEFRPKLCVITDESKRSQIDISKFPGTEFIFGFEGLSAAACYSQADIVLAAATGLSSLQAVVDAIALKKRIAIANKEILVAYGKEIMQLAKNAGSEIIPVDSEHSAIFQCLQGNQSKDLSRILLTASGGAFRDLSYEELKVVKPQDALNHPVWNMGKKITVDSATLMNKGLEVIEAVSLFNCPAEKIKCVIHPQSIIHSMVEYTDSSVIAQMSYPSMELPISYSFFYPDRQPSGLKKLNFFDIKNLTFYEPDMQRFPCLKLAYEAASAGGAKPLILASADEYLVDEFLLGRIGFYDISKYIELSLEKFNDSIISCPDSVYYIDKEVKRFLNKTL